MMSVRWEMSIGYEFTQPIEPWSAMITVVPELGTEPIPGSVRYDPVRRLASFQPATPFRVGEKFQVAVSALLPDGTTIAPETFSFTVPDGPPKLPSLVYTR